MKKRQNNLNPILLIILILVILAIVIFLIRPLFSGDVVKGIGRGIQKIVSPSLNEPNDIKCVAGQIIGDVDGSGQITQNDVDIFEDMLAGLLEEPDNICCLDVNADGDASIADVVKISRIIQGLEESPGVCDIKCLLGDVNHDGIIDCIDVQWILEMVVGSRPVDMCGDISGDGEVTAYDASLLMQQYNLTCQTLTCGDANGDGTVGISDAVYLVNYLFNSGPAPNCPHPYTSCADVNGDGTVGISDAVYLINYLFKGGPEPLCS